MPVIASDLSSGIITIVGAWPSGKATDFESVNRTFESCRPSSEPERLAKRSGFHVRRKSATSVKSVV